MYSDDDDSQERIVLPLVIGVAMFVIVGVLGLVSFNNKPATAVAKPVAAHTATAHAAAPAVAAPAAALNLKDDESQVVVENGVVKFYFASGKAEVAKGANEALADVVKGIKAGQKATISGFHDTTGNAALNAELSKKRAFAVRDALVALGVTEDKLDLVKPADSQGSGAAAEARPVEVVLSK